MSYNAKSEWNKAMKNSQMAYPAEYIIRIFKGEYPRLNFNKTEFVNKKICDLGCGDGRHIAFFNTLGFKSYGIEITQEMVDLVKKSLTDLKINSEIKVGTNDSIPFDSNFFDYLVSWNACYYMGQSRNFDSYVKEFSRILKPNGYLVLSIPKKTCFIYKQSEQILPGYQLIKNDPFNVRNGEVLRMFENEKEIEKAFSSYFTNFIFGSIEDDCFGFNYHWHLAICQKK
jgi:SAM-dependent methyltransferase